MTTAGKKTSLIIFIGIACVILVVFFLLIPDLFKGFFSKDAQPPIPFTWQDPPPHKVYAAGIDKSGGTQRACYWENEEQILLGEEGVYSRAIAIAAFDGSVYIAGEYTYFSDNYSHSTLACCWANGKETKLKAGDYSTVPTDITVAGGKVYVSGYSWHGNYQDACYWEDGVLYELPGGVSADAITINDGKLYIAGRDFTYGTCYWVDGELNILPLGDTVKAIAVEDGRVYVAGMYIDTPSGEEKPKPCIWIDGILNDHPGIELFDMAVVGGTVYTTGIGPDPYQGTDSVYGYWAGSTFNGFKDASSEGGYKISVKGTTVYAAGNYYYHHTFDDTIMHGACIWANSREYALSGRNSEAYAIAVE